LVGIDWADQKHDVCVRDAQGAVLDEFMVLHSEDGFELLRDHVLAAAGCAETQILCAIETNQGLLVNFLLEQGWVVYPINPKAVDRYRDRLKTARAKSDRLDAWLLADILRTDRHLHRPLLPDSDLVRELRELTRGREDLVQEKTRLVNQLKVAVKAYWPESLALFPDLDVPWVLAFLAEYPTLEDARKTSGKALQTFLKARRHPQWRQKAEDLYAALRAPHIATPAFLVRSRSRQALHLIRQLQTVAQDLKAYEKDIARLLRMHPDGQLFLSLPGAGPTLAARMLAEIGDDRERYATANSLQCDGGTAPVTQKSGKTLSVVKFRRACKKQLRHALHLFAGCSLAHCAWANETYHMQRQLGKRHSEALRVVAHKWLKIIFAMRISNTPYDEQRFLDARARFVERSA
jgi:transposase